MKIVPFLVVPEKENTGLAVLSKPHRRSGIQGGALGQTRAAALDYRSSHSPASRPLNNTRQRVCSLRHTPEVSFFTARLWAFTVAMIGFVPSANLGAHAEERSGQVSEPSVGDMTLHVMPQSHIDLAWWWRYDPETVRIIVPHTLETAFGNLEKFPDYTFTFLQVPAIEPLERLQPDLFYKLLFYTHRNRVIDGRLPNPEARGDAGRLVIGSGTWCEFDGCLPCGESLVRQCLHGKRYFLNHFGIDVRTAWFQDAWTHPWTLPQILKKSGMDSYMCSRPRGQGEQMFWWESPDGSRVFAYKPFIVDGENLPSQEAIDRRLADMHRRYGVNDDLTLIGVGNHGGGAIRADVERMRAAMERRESAPAPDQRPARMMFSTPAKFLSAVSQQPHPFPAIRTELEATIRGAYTSVGEIKKGNRYSENLLLTAEKFCSVAAWLGARKYPQAVLFDAWKKVMLNQFHDTISGTDVPPATDDALRAYAEVREAVGAELQAALEAIAARVNTKGHGIPIIVFNPLAWDRNDLVETSLDWPKDNPQPEIIDDQGRPLPMQVIGSETPGDRARLRLLFAPGTVPSLGYKTCWAVPGHKHTLAQTSLKASAGAIENEFFLVRIDPATGCLAQVRDKANSREVLAQPGRANLLQIIDDFGDSEGFLKSADGKEEEHNLWDGPCVNLDGNAAVRLIENGPSRAVIEVKRTFGLARFTQRVSLCRGVPRIDFDLAIDWQGRNKMVKVAFPLAVSSPQAAYEIPYGVITRLSDGKECAAQNWVDITQDAYGVSLLNDSRYGHDITPNTIRLSLLRSPDHPAIATEEQGVHTVRYALYPHAGTWQQAAVVRRGQEFNNALIAVATTAHAGALPSSHAFVRVQPENVLLSALKKAEDSEDLVMRCYESTGQSATTRVTLSDSLAVDAVHTADLLERPQAILPSGRTNFEFPTGAWSIETSVLIRDK